MSKQSQSRWIYNPKIRSIIYQVSAIILVFYFIASITNNALINLETRGITTGFGFLTQPSGFEISQTLITYSASSSYGATFVVGLLNTLLISVIGIVLATLLGFTIGIARLSTNWILAKVSLVYVETFRNIPLLLQILFWYSTLLNALPVPRNSLDIWSVFFLNNRGVNIPSPVIESGFGWVITAAIAAIALVVGLAKWAKKRQAITGQQFPTLPIALAILLAIPLLTFWLVGSPMTFDLPQLGRFNINGGTTIIIELLALLIALVIYTAAFIAEIVRSGIQAVSHGQTEAAQSLGLPANKTLKLIIIPQAMRIIIPPLTSQYLNLAKNSSLATAIGYPDLVAVFAGTTLNQAGQAIEIIFLTMMVYLTISLLTSLFMNWFNRRMALVER